MCQPLVLCAFARMRPHDRGEETLLSSGWTLIGSELPSLIFNLTVRAERSSAIRYLNVVIKPLCSNLDISLDYFRPRNSVCVLFCIALFGRALAKFSRFPTRARECTLYVTYCQNEQLCHNAYCTQSLKQISE